MAMMMTMCCKDPKLLEPEDVTDDLTNILVFGATGMIGGAVAEACVASPWFRTSGFTRAESDNEFAQMLNDKDVKVVQGDLTNYSTVLSAMDDIHCVFLTTQYWESMSTGDEILQGSNVLHAAMEKGVRHLVYASTDYTSLTSNERCDYLEGKAKLEVNIVNSGIPYTIVRLGFFYENLLGIFKPHRIGPNEFVLPFPMGDHALNMGSVLDFGQGIALIAMRPKMYIFQTINLAAEYLTVSEIADRFNDHYQGKVSFTDPKITLEEYMSLDFQGCEELATMWAHFREQPRWDTLDLDTMVPKHWDLAAFVKERTKHLTDILFPNEDITPDRSMTSAADLPSTRGSLQSSSLMATVHSVLDWTSESLSNVRPTAPPGRKETIKEAPTQNDNLFDLSFSSLMAVDTLASTASTAPNAANSPTAPNSIKADEESNISRRTAKSIYAGKTALLFDHEPEF